MTVDVLASTIVLYSRRVARRFWSARWRRPAGG
jgi:hypothetical protein